MPKPKLSQIKQASRSLATFTSAKRNAILRHLASALIKHTASILQANAKDLARLPRNYAMTDRLRLTSQRIADMATSLRAVAALPDPLGEVLETTTRPSGLVIERRRVPLGVVGVIYEARPNVTIEVASLCIKTGNAVVLKGGQDALSTNLALVKIIQAVLPVPAVLWLDPRQRANTTALLQARGLVDVVIPRGSQRLIQFVRATARVPVIETGAGVCHTFVAASANLALAAKVITNAKTRRPTVCNALDCLVVEQPISKALYRVLVPLLAQHQVMIKADPFSYSLLKKHYPPNLLKKSKPADYGKEFLSLTLAIKTVPTAAAGIQFVQTHTSGHSEAIITQSAKLAKRFQQQVDAAAVYVNTSTAFTDGFEFGLGAEVGIATQKLHARGPMGLTALTTYQWFITSRGATRR